VRQPWALASPSREGLQLLELLGGEPGLGPRVRLGGELLGRLAGELDPGVDGGAPASEEAGNVLGRFALLDELHGPEAATLEFFGGPDGSHAVDTTQPAVGFSWLGWSQ
jgi:hypothetical protein